MVELVERVVTKLFYGIHHCENVFRWHIIHNSVYRSNHATAARTQNLHDTPDFIANFRRRAERQNTMRVDAATECDVLAEAFL